MKVITTPRIPGRARSSLCATMRIRNKGFLILLHRFLRSYGLKRTPAPPKPNERVSSSPPAKIPAGKLSQMLIQKGLLVEEERALYQQ